MNLRELRKGSSSLLLLHLLAGGPAYGFELAERLRVATAGELDFKEGTLYPALHRLEQQGLVDSYWQASDAGPQRRYYRLTQDGRQALERGRNDWKRIVEAINGALAT